MTSKPHSEPLSRSSEGYQALDLLQSAYDHGHPDDLALCPAAFETLEGLLEKLEAQRKVINEARGYCWKLNTEGMADTDSLEAALDQLDADWWPASERRKTLRDLGSRSPASRQNG